MVDIADVVTYTKFGDHRLRGFWVAGGQISPSPIDFHRRRYNTLALPCERVISDLSYSCAAFGHYIKSNKFEKWSDRWYLCYSCVTVYLKIFCCKKLKAAHWLAVLKYPLMLYYQLEGFWYRLVPDKELLNSCVCVYQWNYCSYYYFCDIFACLQSGEILIVSFTDVGWSPYFPIVSGLVTEIGGIVSHGIKDTFAIFAMSFAGVAVWLS